MGNEKVNVEKLNRDMEGIVSASRRIQRRIPTAIPVGGTIVSYYTSNRVSFDVDHLLDRTITDFDEILHLLTDLDGWKSTKNTNNIILGKLDGVEVGLRRMFRNTPIKTVRVQTKSGDWIIPTLDEITGMKAILIAKRNAVRDFLDFVALAEVVNDDEKVVEILLGLSEGYSEDWTLPVLQNLCDPNPEDLDEVNLAGYKNLDPKFHDWQIIREICQKYGKKMMVRKIK